MNCFVCISIFFFFEIKIFNDLIPHLELIDMLRNILLKISYLNKKLITLLVYKGVVSGEQVGRSKDY